MNTGLKPRPAEGSATARVWQIADELMEKLGRLPTGREVVDIYIAEGMNEGTGFTQYTHWKKATMAEGASADNGVDPAEPRTLTITPDGRVVIPPALRKAMSLGRDGTVTVWVEDGVLTMMAPLTAVRRMQAMTRRLDTGRGSPVDELIEERRREGCA